MKLSVSAKDWNTMLQNFELISFANADELARAAASAWLEPNYYLLFNL
jgi:hypothetical protein